MRFHPVVSIGLAVSFLVPIQAIAQQSSMNDSKVYGIRELVRILNQQPNSLKGKKIRLEAVAVDATKGIGCDSGSTLIDKSDLAEYQKISNEYHPEVYQKLNAIPSLQTGPTIGIPTMRRPIRMTSAQVDELRPIMRIRAKTSATHEDFPVSVVPASHATIYDGHFFDAALMKHCGEESGRRIMLDSVVRSNPG